jgi:transposase
VTLTIADTDGRGADDGVVSRKPGPRADQPRRRSFTSEYKLAMVAEYDRLTEPGARGALLRREGLYHSHIIEWRKARDAGTLSTSTGSTESNPPSGSRAGRKRGKSSEQAEIERLRRQNERLAADLARNKAALEIMGKAHALLELLSESADPTREGRSER